MTSNRRTLDRREFLAASTVALGAAMLPAVPASARPRARPDHVILVDWDGFGLDFLSRAPMPNLRALIAQGSLSRGESTYSSYSNSARASMSTGAYPAVHGNAGYYLEPTTNTVVSQNRVLQAQTINQALAGQGLTTASVGWYMVQNFGTSYGDPEHLYVQPGTAPQYRGQLASAFATRVDVVREILHRRPVDSNGQQVTVPRIPAFVAVYEGAIDALVHEEGPGSPGLPALLTAFDLHLGRLVQAVRDAGIIDRTAFVLTADHAMGLWNRPLMPSLLQALAGSGFRAEVVLVGRSPAADTDIVLTSNGVRQSNVYLRRTAAGAEGQAAVRRAAGRVGHIPRVFDRRDLKRLGASPKLGDLALDAAPGYHFSLLTDGKDRGSHGSTFELSVPIVLSGVGVRARRFGTPGAGLVDIAPTVAALLGAEPPAQARGRSLV